MADKAKGTTNTVFIVTILLFLSKILGFLRETLIGANCDGGVTDVFFLALSPINIFTIVLTNSIGWNDFNSCFERS